MKTKDLLLEVAKIHTIEEKVNDIPTKTDINNAQYYEYPTIHYDDAYTKGYVDVTELKPDIIYKMPKYPEVELGSFSQICICCKNDDGTIFRINNKANTLGFSHKVDASIFLIIKIDSQIIMEYKSNNDYYIINLKKTDGVWGIYQLKALKPGSNEEYTPTSDYHPTTKKYVDDKVAGIVDSAPETLDTLNELSKALGDDPNFATTVATQIGNKVDKEDGKTLTTNDLSDELKANYDAAYTYSQATHSYNDLTDKPEIPSIDGLATEEYVNDNIIRKYSQLEDVVIEVLPYTEKMNSITNTMTKLSNIDVFTLESNKTYMTVSDCYRLRLVYQKLDGTDIAFYTSYYTGNLIIQTGNKTDELIEILIDGVMYTATFKTDTEEPKVEKNIRYLTNINTIEYTPTADYHPATKKYVDDVKASIVVPTKTSELTNDSNYLTSIPDEYITETELLSKGYLTEHQSLDGYAKTSDIPSVEGLATEDYVTKAIAAASGSSDVATDDEVKSVINDILGGDYVE